MADRDSRERVVADVDSKKTDFWKAPELLSSIPARLLMQTNWFVYHQHEIANMIAIKESSGSVNVDTLDAAIGKYNIVFKLPGTADSWDNLQEVMFRLRLKQRQTDARQDLIQRLKSEGKDATYHEHRLSRGRRPHPMDDAFINSFLDTLRFQVSEISLNELRYQTPMRRVSAQMLREEMDND